MDNNEGIPGNGSAAGAGAGAGALLIVSRDGLEIGSNNSLLVEEGTSVRVTHQDLR